MSRYVFIASLHYLCSCCSGGCTTRTHWVIIIIKKNVFYFFNQSTVKPSSLSLLLLNLIFYKLDINVIQGPSQNASWSVLQRGLFTLYKTLHTRSSTQKSPCPLSPDNKNVQKEREKKISSHFLSSHFTSRCIILTVLFKMSFFHSICKFLSNQTSRSHS